MLKKKSLKEFLQEYAAHQEDNTDYHIMNEYQAISAVKEWLEPKLKMQPTDNAVSHSNERQRIKTIRNLLEELK